MGKRGEIWIWPSPVRHEAEMESLRLFTFTAKEPAFTLKLKKNKKHNIRQLWRLGSSICK